MFLAGCLIIFGNPGFDGIATGRVCVNNLLDGTAKAYAEEMDARIEAYQDPNVAEVYVQPLSEQANSCILRFIDLSSDPKSWPNSSMTMYYGKMIYLAQ